MTSRAPLAVAAALAAAGCGSDPSTPVCPASGYRLVSRTIDATALPDPGAGTCVRDVRPTSASPGMVVLAAASHHVGDVLSFDVPPETQSISIVSQAVPNTTVDTLQASTSGGTVTIGNTVVPTSIVGPDGRMVFDDTDMAYFPADGSALFAFYGGQSVSTGAFTLPNTTAALIGSQGGVAPGTWTFRVNDWAYECATAVSGCTGSTAGQYVVEVLAKPTPSTATGTLDADFYLVTTTGLTSQQAIADPNVQRMVSTLAQVLGRGGICLGDVTFYDVPTWVQQRYAQVDIDASDPCSPLSQLFTASRGARAVGGSGNAVSFFLVDDFVSSAGGKYQAIGLDGSIPGPSSYAGTVQSGAAVWLADLMAPGGCGSKVDVGSCGPDAVGYVAAHEAGHWLGLYHTTESTGDAFDPLIDTKTCPCETCAPSGSHGECATIAGSSSASPYLVTASDCLSKVSCGGADNLMFWLLDVTSVGRITAEQGMVMRANALVH